MRHTSHVLAASALLLSLAACRDTTPVAPDTAAPLLAKAPARADAPVISTLGIGLPGVTAVGGDYVNGSNGTVSILQSYLGDWELDLTSRSSTRTFTVNLSDALPGNPRSAPFSQAAVTGGRIIAKASQITPGSFPAMVLNTPVATPLSVAFAYGGKQYGLRMNTANHSQTQYASATCTATGTSGCSAWSIVPSDASGKNIAFLEEVGKNSTTPIGFFRVGFAVTLRR